MEKGGGHYYRPIFFNFIEAAIYPNFSITSKRALLAIKNLNGGV
jgi:hypothetical protein